MTAEAAAGPDRVPSPGAPEVLLETKAGGTRILFSPIDRLAELADPARTVVVTDAFVRRHVPPAFPAGRIVEVPRGEEAKSLACLQSVYERFLEIGVGRDWTVLGVGGGSVSDLAGFAASTWHRGVDIGFVPTTVLAMVDASVGGKNGINLGVYKNLVGAFRLPRFVLVDPAFLSTLPARETASGLVEAVKHAVIDGPDHIALLERTIPPRPAGAAFAMPRDPAALTEVLARSVRLKARVVAADFLESGERRKLNLGHTVGHAVEAVTGLPHGECVSVGLACALGLAARRGGSTEDAGRILDLLDRLGAPGSLEGARSACIAARAAGTNGRSGSSGPGDPAALEACLDAAAFREAVARALSADKKRAGDLVLFALPRALGSVVIETIELSEIENYVREAP